MVGSVPIWAKMSPKKGFDFPYKIYNLTFQKYLDNDKISLKSKKGVVRWHRKYLKGPLIQNISYMLENVIKFHWISKIILVNKTFDKTYQTLWE